MLGIQGQYLYGFPHRPVRDDRERNRNDKEIFMEHGIVLPPEVLIYFKNFPITNTLLVSWITMLILTVLSIALRFRVKLVPGNLQSVFEVIIDGAYSTVEGLAGDKKAKVFFPIVTTFLLF